MDARQDRPPPARGPRSDSWRLACRLAPLFALLAALAAADWAAAGMLVGRPFPGFLVEPQGHVAALMLRGWPGQAAGLTPYAQVVAMDGVPVGSGPAILERVAAAPIGTPVRYTLLELGGGAREVVVPTARFTPWDLLRASGLLWAAGVAHFVIGALVLLARPRHPAAWAHWWMCVAFGGFLVTAAGLLSERLPPVLNQGLGAAMGPTVVALGLLFPVPLLSRAGRVLVVGALAAIALAITVAQPFASGRTMGGLLLAADLMSGLTLPLVVAVWGWIAFSRRFPADARGPARVVMAGLALAFGPAIATTIVAPHLGTNVPGIDFAELSFVAFPLSVAYAILRHGAFDFRPAARAVMLYAGLAGGLALVYGLAVAGCAAVAGGPSAGLAPFAAAVAVAVAFRPVHDALRRALDRAFLGERLEAVQALAALADRPGVTADAVAAELVALARRLVRPTWAGVWAAGERLAATGDAPAEPPADAPLRIGFALPDGQAGWLALGPRETEVAYSATERGTLEILAAHAGAAIGSARLWEERLAMRVREATARALAAEREKLVHQLVHDLRTDLFNVVLATDLGRHSGDADAALADVARSARRMDAFLAEKAQLVAGGRPGATATVKEALEGAARAIAPTLEGRRQALVLEVAVGVPAVGLSDVALGQVALNLLTNASKFSPDGATLRCEVAAEDGWVTLAVADQGPGLPEGFQLGMRAHPDVPGHGLGLRNVAALVEAASGSLGWRNVEGGGAEVAIRLPEAAP